MKKVRLPALALAAALLVAACGGGDDGDSGDGGSGGDGGGLSLYQVVRDLQILLATWTGACPTCHRDIPTPIPT